jgi:hypothetical protein
MSIVASIMEGNVDRPLTAQEAADKLGYHIHHLYRLLREGTVKGERFNQAWMIDPAEVERVKALQGAGGRLPKSSSKDDNPQSRSRRYSQPESRSCV